MTTSAYITWLLDRTGNTVTRTELLTMVNIAQNEIYSIDSYFTRTKPDPFLSTTTGVYTYTLGASVRRVSRVYALSSNANYNPSYVAYNGFGGSLDYKQGKPFNRTGSPEIDIPVDTIESVTPDSAGCQIIFPSQHNPGTTTDVFQIEQYVWPTQLTAETVSISIPEGFKTTLLYYKVMRLLEEQEYHNAIYSERKEIEYTKKWIQYANTGAKSFGNSTVIPRTV